MKDHSVYCPHGPHQLAGNPQGKLHGLRLVYKDLYGVAGYRTGAGNPAWFATHDPVPETAPVLQTLLDAGLEVVGRVQTDELAYSLNGQNAHFGTPINPVTPDRLPGGSSSGCAVAVAGHEADVGLGTDTGGSIRVPACYQGLYGLRPTQGRLPLAGVVPLAPRFDTAGWMCRDGQTMLRVGQCLFPPAEPDLPDNPWHHLRLLWLDELFAALPDAAHKPLQQIVSRLESTVSELTRLTIVDLLTPSDNAGLPVPLLLSGESDPFTPLSVFSEAFRILQGREIARTHQTWVSAHLHDLGPEIASRFQWAFSLSHDDEQGAEQIASFWCHQASEWLQQGFLVLPTIPDFSPLRCASSAELGAFRARLMSLTALAGLAGLPQVQLPFRSENGLPLGVSIIGPKNSDLMLLALASGWSEICHE